MPGSDSDPLQVAIALILSYQQTLVRKGEAATVRGDERQASQLRLRCAELERQLAIFRDRLQEDPPRTREVFLQVIKLAKQDGIPESSTALAGLEVIVHLARFGDAYRDNHDLVQLIESSRVAALDRPEVNKEQPLSTDSMADLTVPATGSPALVEATGHTTNPAGPVPVSSVGPARTDERLREPEAPDAASRVTKAAKRQRVLGDQQFRRRLEEAGRRLLTSDTSGNISEAQRKLIQKNRKLTKRAVYGLVGCGKTTFDEYLSLYKIDWATWKAEAERKWWSR